MSERSFRRQRERRIAVEERRHSLRKRRAGLVGGIAVGAFALAPTAAQAANFEVNSLNDPGDGTCDATECTLREAINASNVSGTDDTITFQAGLTGTITLDQTSGPLVVNKNSSNSTTITGPGADNLYVSGGGNILVLDVQNTGFIAGLTISGLTIGNGFSDIAGGIYAEQGTYVNLSDSTVTGNTATGARPAKYVFAGGGGITNRGSMTIQDSTITDNYADTIRPSGTKYGGGGGIDNVGQMTISGSTIDSNGSRYVGGGILDGITKYPTSLGISNTTISNNGAPYGGGIAGLNVPGSAGSSNHKVTNSTISGNFSDLGGGLAFKYPGGSSKWTVSHSTVSHNEASEAGGGIDLGFVTGSVNLVDSTVSGNDAGFVGGGAYISSAAQKYEGALQFNNSTIASNTAGGDGGGLYLDYTEPGRGYVATPLFSTIVGDNAANGALNDLAEGTDTNPSAGAFDLSFSLVRAPGNATITQTPAGSNLIGVDPLLAGLGDNGGQTETQLPSINSPVVDKGSAPGNLTTDQRGLARTVDTGVPNAHDGTDIGAVELPTGPPAPPPPAAGGGTGTKVGTLKKKHRKRRRVIRTKHAKAKIRLTFHTSTPGVTFQCSVDGGAFSPCRSPFTTRVSSAPGKGKNHNISIKQVDAAGNQVGNVRVFRFRVVLKD